MSIPVELSKGILEASLNSNPDLSNASTDGYHHNHNHNVGDSDSEDSSLLSFDLESHSTSEASPNVSPSSAYLLRPGARDIQHANSSSQASGKSVEGHWKSNESTPEREENEVIEITKPINVLSVSNRSNNLLFSLNHGNNSNRSKGGLSGSTSSPKHYRSYFHADNTKKASREGVAAEASGDKSMSSNGHKGNDSYIHFSISHELDCCIHHFSQLFKRFEANRLPWSTDFADFEKFSIPKNGKEISARLNLNIPYYGSNYLELCYLFDFFFLLKFDIFFFIFSAISCVGLHSILKNDQVALSADDKAFLKAKIALNKKRGSTQEQVEEEEDSSNHKYSKKAQLFGRSVAYHSLAHAFLGVLTVLIIFFEAARTIFALIILNLLIIIPHALLRNVTYFDDEDMEKLRPKIIHYVIVLGVLLVLYLEGDTSGSKEDLNVRLAEEHRQKLKEKRAAKMRP